MNSNAVCRSNPARAPARAPGSTARRCVQPFGHLAEKVLRLPGKVLVDLRGIVRKRLVARVLGIEDAQRVLFQPLLRILAERSLVGAEVIDQRQPPGLAAGRIAQRVEVECHAVRYSKFLEQLVGHDQKLDIGLRLGRADYFGVDLVELAVAALLRALVANRGP